MDARFTGTPGSEEWELVGARGCCRFAARVVDGRTEVELGPACHACINELNGIALERGWVIVRRGEAPPGRT